MDNYIVINGKKADLTPEQLKALGIEVKKSSPFNRVGLNGKYYSIAMVGTVDTFYESYGCEHDRLSHYVANYCADKDLLQQQAYRETLNRLLWRFSMEHGGDEIDWDSIHTKKFYIYFNHKDDKWCVDECYWCMRFGSVHFKTKEIAERAIEEIVKPFIKIHPDFNYKGE